MATRNYIAGPELADAQRVCGVLVDRGYWVTQGYWDGAGDTPQIVQENCAASIENLGRFRGSNYVSVKLPALDYDENLLGTLLDQSDRQGVPLHFDSLAPEHATSIFSCMRHMASISTREIGCTLPGRWLRSIKDADMAVELGATVRVVKGQWDDPEAPHGDPRAGCLQVIDRLAGRARCVRVASHDVSLAREALTRLRNAGTCCELELLYGLPAAPLVSVAEDLQVPVRFYVAYGTAYLPYALSNLRTNPKMLMPLVKEAFKRNYLSSIPIHSSS